MTDTSNLSDYLASLSGALATFLRPYRGRLPERWLGIDRAQRSFLLRRSARGYSAVLVGKWLGAPVVEKSDPAAGAAIVAPFAQGDQPAGTVTNVAIAVKRIAGECNASITLTGDWRLVVTLESPSSTFELIGPELVQGLTKEQAAVYQGPSYSGPAPRFATPGWVLGIVSNIPDDPLRGFDPDPIIMANGTAEAILRVAGIRPPHEASRYSEAAAALRWAVSSLSAENESVLQALLEAKPWILLHEAEFDHVLPRQRVELSERVQDGSDEQHVVVPDFIYHQQDSQSLVVEIESARKRLQLAATETSYAVPAQATFRSMFQILNYRRIFSGPLGVQVRRQLNKPDSWAFRYLLVVGSRLQPDFHERSWSQLRDHLHDAGVELRHWDYYIDRLDRIARMSETEPLGGAPPAA